MYDRLLRNRFSLVLLCCLGLVPLVSAQNRQVTGTTDANGVYVLQDGTINGKPFYQISGQQRTIYSCEAATAFNGGGFTCGAEGWLIASQPYTGASTSSSTVLYYFQSSATTPPIGTYNSLNGASATADVSDTAELPVELVSFEGLASGDQVQLRWTTASETNNAGFAVEMKQHGTFTEQGFVAGHGTTSEAQRYRFDAGTLAPGRYVFRLRQVDFDGAFDYSPEVEVSVSLSEAIRFTTPQPNPMRGAAQFQITVQQGQPVSVRVYDMLGRAVATLFEGPMAAGETKTLTFERGTLPAGLYLIQLQGAQVQSTRQITLL